MFACLLDCLLRLRVILGCEGERLFSRPSREAGERRGCGEGRSRGERKHMEKVGRGRKVVMKIVMLMVLKTVIL